MSYPPVPKGVYGVCEGCGAVAWELLTSFSPLCLGCAPEAYRGPDEDVCPYCDGDCTYECEDDE